MLGAPSPALLHATRGGSLRHTARLHRAAPALSCRRAALRIASAATAEAMALRTYHLDALSAADVKALLARPRVDFSAILETVRACRRLPHRQHSAPPADGSLARLQVRPIVEAVRERGDAAVSEYTARFDGVTLPAHVLCVAVRQPGPLPRRGSASSAAVQTGAHAPARAPRAGHGGAGVGTRGQGCLRHRVQQHLRLPRGAAQGAAGG
jgi:hypothetical protein